jgi:hypothetical protein
LSALRDRDYRIVPIKTDRNDAFIGSVKVSLLYYGRTCCQTMAAWPVCC